MSRHRSLSTDISSDARVAELAESGGALAMLLYTWAIPHADDWGRLTGDARQFKLLVCPGLDVTVREVEVALEQIAAVGLWQRYAVEGRAWLAFPSAAWYRHQNYIRRDKRDATDGSRIPAPPVDLTAADAAAAAADADVADDVSETNAAKRRASPKIAANHRQSPPITASSSPTPTPALSSPPEIFTGEGGDQRERDMCANIRADVCADDLAADAALSLIAPPALVQPSPHAGSPASGKVTPITRAPVMKGATRVPDPVWDACIAVMGSPPTNSVERGRWAKGIKALRESVPDPTALAAEIAVRARRYRSRFGTSVPLNPMALAGNWSALATDIPNGASAEENRHHGRSATYGRSRGVGQAGRQAGRTTQRPAFGTPEYYAQAATATS